MIYLDTSALIKLYLREDGSEAVQRLVAGQDAPLPVWELQETELINALNLKVFRQELYPAEADAQIALLMDRKARGLYFMPDLDRSAILQNFRILSPHTRQLGCRTLDILHVCCALQLHPDFFATFDARQKSLAQQAGLQTWPE